MKIGDWVIWNGGSNVGRVAAICDGMVQVNVCVYPPDRLSVTTFTLPYRYEQLTVVPEAIAKIINS